MGGVCDTVTQPVRDGVEGELAPRAGWSSMICATCSMHQGWLVDLELLAPDLTPQLVAQELPLSGISLADEALDIEGHGQVTRLRIRSPMIPSEVDGVLP